MNKLTRRPDIEEAKRLLNYDPETGHIYTESKHKKVEMRGRVAGGAKRQRIHSYHSIWCKNKSPPSGMGFRLRRIP